MNPVAKFFRCVRASRVQVALEGNIALSFPVFHASLVLDCPLVTQQSSGWLEERLVLHLYLLRSVHTKCPVVRRGVQL